jgi:predicted AlkP superfamily pyrophosphatase or phosphodiesterase
VKENGAGQPAPAFGPMPSVTYPIHTTIVTGVWPAKHGIYANTTFDPLGKNQSG